MPDPSGSGRVDMLTTPVAAAQLAVATGPWVKSKHDMYLIRRSLGFIFAHPPEGEKKLKKAGALRRECRRLVVSPPPSLPHPPTPPPSRWPALITLPPLAKVQLVWRRLCEAPLIPFLLPLSSGTPVAAVSSLS